MDHFTIKPDLHELSFMKNLISPLTTAEYFAGIGLIRMGLEPCGWEVVFANDISHKKYYKIFSQLKVEQVYMKMTLHSIMALLKDPFVA